MTTAHLPRSTPSAEGVSAAGVSDFLDGIEREGLELHSLMVVKAGRVIAEGWWAPYGAEGVHLLHSLSKSFTATAAGLAAAEGLLDLEDLVLDHFPEHGDAVTDPRTRGMRIRHLATMATGHREDTWDRVIALDPADPVRGFLRLPPEQDPGSAFTYNNGATLTLGAIVQRRAGQRLLDYLRPRLLDPLGIAEAYWLARGGVELGFSGLHLTTESVAKFGLLYLDDGVWQGRRLLPEGWVAEATRAHMTTPGEPEPDWRRGYGYQFWRSRHGFRGDGAYGQFCLVLPGDDAVVVTTAATERMQAILDQVWIHLQPALAAPGHVSSDEALARRLATVAIRPCPGDPRRADPGDWSTVLRPSEATRAAIETLTELHLEISGEAAAIALVDGGVTVRAQAGFGSWITSGSPPSFAGSAAWMGPGALGLEIIFLDTPHRLLISASAATGTFDARWRTIGLHTNRPALMQAPRAGTTPDGR